MSGLPESYGRFAATASGQHPVFFDAFRFLPPTGELWRGEKELKLTPRAAAVLRLLVERAQQIVTKQELLDRVWEGNAVGDEALTSCVQELRRTLDDDARKPRYIETRHRRGYRLIVPVMPVALALPEKPSIAVLPFVNRSGDPEQEYFADGITEDIITELSRFHSLFVIARNSSFSYKGRSPSIRQAGAELGVRYLLQGSVRKSGNRVRLTGQLIDATTGAHLWAERYDRELNDIFAVQAEVTQAIVAAIAPEIEWIELSKATRRYPDNLSAYDIALRAWAHATEALGRADRTLLERSIQEAREALAIDPDSVQALQVIAYAYGQALLLQMAGDQEYALQQATLAATRAIELDSTDAYNYSLRALAVLRSRRLDLYPAALADARLAHQMNPNHADVLRILAGVEAGSGEPESSIEHALQVLRLNPQDPRSHITYNLLSFASFAARRYADGIAWASRALSNMPGMIQAQKCLVICLVGAGEIDKAKVAFASLQEMAPEYAKGDLEGMSLYRRPDDRIRALAFLRIAAGLEAPGAAIPLR
jgi:TolB-like protein